MPNFDLTWESTTQLDMGIDLGLFNNRLTIIADVFKDNLIIYVQMDEVSDNTMPKVYTRIILK